MPWPAAFRKVISHVAESVARRTTVVCSPSVVFNALCSAGAEAFQATVARRLGFESR